MCILSPQRHVFVQGDKQSEPAALEHQQMNSDEVRVNIRRVPTAEMMDVGKRPGLQRGAGLWLGSGVSNVSGRQKC